jgi:HEAT repeat protein
LASEDAQGAFRAAEPLCRIPELPAGSSQLISRALTKQLDLAKQRLANDAGLFFDLAYLASRVGTDDALEALLKLAQTESLRGHAVSALAKFKQEKAVNQLHAFLKDEDKEIQFTAA